VRAGPARERERSSRRDARDLGSSGLRCSVSETRCNGGAFRDRSSPASGSGHPSQMGGVRRRAKQCFATRLPHPWPLLVWPSLAKQLPPGTTIAPLTWQRHRHGSQKPPGPFYEARFVGAGPARERERSSRQDAREIANGGTNSVSGIPPAGFAGLSLARQAPTKPHSIERFGASDNPGPWMPPSKRVCVLPFRERCEYVPVRSLSNVLFSRVPEGQNTDTRPRMEGASFQRRVSGILPGG